MTKRELQALLTELGVRPSRRLGQNFLIDPNLLDALVRDAAPCAGEALLEVGAGTGVLTRRLLQAGARVTAVELDHRLAAYLERVFGGHPGFRLLRDDACRLDYDRVMAGEPFRCIANLPYAGSSAFLARLAALRAVPEECFVLVQRELAERLAATPGSKTFGALSVCVGLVFTARICRTVPGAVFWPAPEVESAFVCLARRPELPSRAARRAAMTLARSAFGQRRKQMLNVLTARYERGRVRAAFHELGIAVTARPEQVSPAQFAALATRLLAPRPQ